MTYRIAAFGLVLWLSGLGCALGCAPHVSAASLSESSAAEQKLGPADGAADLSCSEHACCHRLKVDRGELPLEAVPPPTSIMACCLLAGQAADPARKSRVGDKLNFALTAAALPALPKAATSAASPAARRQYLPDRGGTYLRCCVFLI